MSPDPSPIAVISDCPALDAARTALILPKRALNIRSSSRLCAKADPADLDPNPGSFAAAAVARSEEHTSELQSHRDLHSFPTRRSSDLAEARAEHSQLLEALREGGPGRSRSEPGVVCSGGGG